jgi:uncharacterized phiE125 gp8 family phage protein
MNLIEITPPAVEPVSIATLKLHLRLDTSTEDALLAVYLAAARRTCEQISRRAFITQTLAVLFDAWPMESGIIEIPRPPLQSVASLIWKDKDGTPNSFTDYILDINSTPGRLSLGYAKVWPGKPLYPVGAIQIQFNCGYGATIDVSVPEQYRTAVMLLAAYWYEQRMSVASLQLAEVPFGVKTLCKMDRGSWF